MLSLHFPNCQVPAAVASQRELLQCLMPWLLWLPTKGCHAIICLWWPELVSWVPWVYNNQRDSAWQATFSDTVQTADWTHPKSDWNTPKVFLCLFGVSAWETQASGVTTSSDLRELLSVTWNSGCYFCTFLPLCYSLQVSLGRNSYTYLEPPFHHCC